jgi:hypothetical protein
MVELPLPKDRLTEEKHENEFHVSFAQHKSLEMKTQRNRETCTFWYLSLRKSGRCGGSGVEASNHSTSL